MIFFNQTKKLTLFLGLKWQNAQLTLQHTTACYSLIVVDFLFSIIG